MKTTLSTALTPANIATVTRLLTETPPALEALAQSRTSEQLRAPLEAGEWSLTQILAHLIHSEARTSESIYLSLLADEPLFFDIHPEREWGRLLRYDQFEFPELVAYFKLRRVVLLRVLASLTPQEWARTIREEGKARRESVYWRTRAMSLHEQEHLADIADNL